MGYTTHRPTPLPPLPARNPSPTTPPALPPLLEFVNFKWQMASEGHRVDLDRLQHEPAYARGCLAVAGGSTSSALRQAADRLAHGLQPLLAGQPLPSRPQALPGP